jgi:hypothetical protein
LIFAVHLPMADERAPGKLVFRTPKRMTDVHQLIPLFG